jgi:hypothetical protein
MYNLEIACQQSCIFSKCTEWILIESDIQGIKYFSKGCGMYWLNGSRLLKEIYARWSYLVFIGLQQK